VYDVGMQSKIFYYIGAGIGSTIGAYIPVIWGASVFSLSSVIFSAIGGIAGIVIVWKSLK
jgi:hypothetical protein